MSGSVNGKMYVLIMAVIIGSVLAQSSDAMASSRRCDTRISDVGIDSSGNLTVYFTNIYYMPSNPYIPPQQLTLTACNVNTDAHCEPWQKLLSAAVLTQKLVLINLYSSQSIPSCTQVPNGTTQITRVRLTSVD